jgi:hypothetical protein
MLLSGCVLQCSHLLQGVLLTSSPPRWGKTPSSAPLTPAGAPGAQGLVLFTRSLLLMHHSRTWTQQESHPWSSLKKSWKIRCMPVTQLSGGRGRRMGIQSGLPMRPCLKYTHTHTHAHAHARTHTHTHTHTRNLGAGGVCQW